MGLNKALLGREYDECKWTVDGEQMKKYAIGYNEDNPMFLDDKRPGGVVGPPMFGVVYIGPNFAQAFFDSELNVNFARLVHAEQDMTFYRLLKPGEEITSKAKIIAIEEKSSGEIFSVEIISKDAAGKQVQKAIGSFFIRGGKKDAGGAKKEEKAAPKPEPKKDVVFKSNMTVKDNQTHIYAEGSGDHNPIHIDNDFAKSVGLPGIILQGLCTMAFASKAVMDSVAGKDPNKLKRLKVRFSKPVLPKETVTTSGWVIEKKGNVTVFGFEVKNQSGDVVISNGVAEIAG